MILRGSVPVNDEQKQWFKEPNYIGTLVYNQWFDQYDMIYNRFPTVEPLADTPPHWPLANDLVYIRLASHQKIAFFAGHHGTNIWKMPSHW